MIIEAIIDMIFLPLQGLINLLPNVSSPPTPPIETALEIVSYSAYFFPMGVFVFLINNFLFWYTALLTWAIIEWTYKKIPGVS